MEKNLEYYLNLPYTREIKLGQDGIWFACIKELPGCFSQGETKEEALNNIDDAMIGWLEIELEDGETIPEPKEDEEYSGTFNTRVPKSLHHKIVDMAERDGVSMNQWINDALSEAVGLTSKTKFHLEVYEYEKLLGLEWRGLATGINKIIDNVGLNKEGQGFNDEIFHRWLKETLEEIESYCDYGALPKALENCNKLSTIIAEYSYSSPILKIIYNLLINYSNRIEYACGLDEVVQRNKEFEQFIIDSGTYEKIKSQQEEERVSLEIYEDLFQKKNL